MIYDVVIIGAGIVGLSVGYNLLQERPGLSIALVDKEKEVAFHQTGRNSGVIHSGIYYKPGSSKAVNCRKGYELMLRFCRQQGIEYDICGKIIVASNREEEGKLLDIYNRGVENGLAGLKIISEGELKELEPHVRGAKGIHVPQAGIVNYKQVANRLRKILEDSGAGFYLGSEVKKISSHNGQHRITCENDELETSFLVNCAGLYSDKIAEMNDIQLDAKIIPFRGEYYLLKDEKKHLVKNLIYPVPNPAFPFLGVHFTRRINGSIDAGPNAVLAFRREGYRKSDFKMDEFLETITYPGFLKVALRYWRVGIYEMYRSFSKRAFVEALQKLIPEITEDDLVTGGSGVRAQLCQRDGNLVDDFMIEYAENAVHVINAPSPAATSALQIGKLITEKILYKLA